MNNIVVLVQASYVYVQYTQFDYTVPSIHTIKIHILEKYPLIRILCMSLMIST